MNTSNPPLPREARESFPSLGDGHHGLWYDRFFNQYNKRWQVYKEGEAPEIKEGKREWIRSVEGQVGDKHALKNATLRLATLCKSQGGEFDIFTASWHFVTGLGNAHPIENGFLWHPTLGVPYIPGAAVKGLIRAWLEGEWEEPRNNEKLHRWFGSEDKDPEKCKNDNEAGAFVFFDALPLEPVTLKADVMTPHMNKWYEKGGDDPLDDPLVDPEVTPADWHNPVPIPFLVADKPKFMFAVAPRTGKKSKDLPKLMAMFADALAYLGAGAKTAVGYGHMPERDEKNRRIMTEKIDRAALSTEEWISAEVKKLSPEELAKKLGRKIKKTKKEKGDSWEAYLEEIVRVHGEVIRSWEFSNKADEKMTYKTVFKDKEGV